MPSSPRPTPTSHAASSADAAPSVPGHGHSHTARLRLPAGQSRRVRAVLAALVFPLVVATLVGLVALWPSHHSLVGSRPFLADGATMEHATIATTDVSQCSDAVLDLDGVSTQDLLKDAVCATIETGQGKGLVLPVHIPLESRGIARVGDHISVMYSPTAIGAGTPYVFIDYERDVPVGILAAIYGLLILAVAGWKGLRALLGLGLSLGVLAFFVIPALLEGSPALWVTLVGVMSMILLAVYIAHGISIRTTTALLGTVLGVVVTVSLSLWGVDAARLTGAASEEAVTVASLVEGIHLPALLTCGMVIAGLGVLNDVTITQASAVWELHAANPLVNRRRLFASAMSIGRDHIASTVYTLAFAYAGTALPLILGAALMDRSVIDTLMAGDIGEEIVRTLISSVGLVLAIPLTTAIAALLCAHTHSRSLESSQASDTSLHPVRAV